MCPVTLPVAASPLPLWLLLVFSLARWLLAIGVQLHKGMAYFVFILPGCYVCQQNLRFCHHCLLGVLRPSAPLPVCRDSGDVCVSLPIPALPCPPPCSVLSVLGSSSFLAFRPTGDNHVSHLLDYSLQFQDSHLVPFFPVSTSQQEVPVCLLILTSFSFKVENTLLRQCSEAWCANSDRLLSVDLIL